MILHSLAKTLPQRTVVEPVHQTFLIGQNNSTAPNVVEPELAPDDLGYEDYGLTEEDILNLEYPVEEQEGLLQLLNGNTQPPPKRLRKTPGE